VGLARAGQEDPYATTTYITATLQFDLLFIDSLIKLNLTETQFSCTYVTFERYKVYNAINRAFLRLNWPKVECMVNELSGILRSTHPQHPKKSTPPNIYYWFIWKTRGTLNLATIQSYGFAM
jgi:hypothetical protein